jgi:hypothetical protein
MHDANAPQARVGWSLRWRALCLIYIAVLQIGLIWAAVKRLPESDAGFLVLALPLTAALIASGYDVVRHGKLTRSALWFWLAIVLIGSARDVYKFWHDSLREDPWWTFYGDAVFLWLCIMFVRKNGL